MSALGSYGDTVRLSIGEARRVDAQLEEQLKAPVAALVEACGALVLDRSVVTARPEARARELATRPDLAILVGGLRIGDVELKAPGLGANPRLLRGEHNQVQWAKLKYHPNLIYTDGREWALFRFGKLVGSAFRSSGDPVEQGAAAFNERDAERFEALLRGFVTWEPIVPRTPHALALHLAPLCRLLRAEVLEALARPDSAMCRIASDWRRVLFPESDDDQFADAYAQTVTYALLLARVEGATDLAIGLAAGRLMHGHGLLAQALLALTEVGLLSEISLGVELLQRVVAAVDPALIRSRQQSLNLDPERRSLVDEDPWLYFYEDFLAAYDPRLRSDRGVYYTPVAVVCAQVRLVGELLRTRLEKPLAFASDGVNFLDPGCGTGSYPLAAIDYSLQRVEEEFGAGAKPGRASVLAANLHAFEILVGPYAVAHLRITQAIAAAEGQMPTDGTHVYLTNTLESPNVHPHTRMAFGGQLSEEHQRAQAIKGETPVWVCLGNPPYNREESGDEDGPGVSDNSRWIREGDPGSDWAPLDDFISPVPPEDRVKIGRCLYNDYVYFWRWALWKVFESPSAPGPGVVSFITAASYLRGDGYKGMREVMRRTFDELWILDLEGDSIGARKTPNVFQIRTPVAIAVGVRYGAGNGDQPATAHYARVTGSRDDKLAELDRIGGFACVEWEPVGSGWHDRLTPVPAGDFMDYPSIQELVPWQHTGVDVHRTWPIGTTQSVLEERWRTLVAAPVDARGGLLGANDDTLATGVYGDFVSGERLAALSTLEAGATPTRIARYGYRALDRRWIIGDRRVVDRPRPALWIADSPTQVYFTSIMTNPLGRGPALFVSAYVPDKHHFCARGDKGTMPMWRDAACTVPNLNASVLDVLELAFGKRPSVEDVFAYMYGVLSAPGYVDAFWDELSELVPRVPITRDPELFAEVAKVGGELICVHTWGERFADSGHDVRLGRRALCVRPVPGEIDGYPEESTYEAATETLRVGDGAFAPVAREVWEYSVSDYAIVPEWLRSRRRAGVGSQGSDLDRIRVERWRAQDTEELLDLLWRVEATIEYGSRLNDLLTAVLAGDCVKAEDISEATPALKRAPRAIDPDAPVLFG